MTKPNDDPNESFKAFYTSVEALYSSRLEDLTSHWYSRGFPNREVIDRFKQIKDTKTKMHDEESMNDNNICSTSSERNSASQPTLKRVRHTHNGRNNDTTTTTTTTTTTASEDDDDQVDTAAEDLPALEVGRTLRDRGSNKKNKSTSKSVSMLQTNQTFRRHGINNHTTTALGINEVDRIREIRIGSYLIDTWYISPYPQEYSMLKTLYMCDYCLEYMKSEYILARHSLKCRLRHPPGDEIYRDKKVTIFEVDGRKNKTYCQRLCLLSRCFLDSKTLFYDVEPFLFYVLTETDNEGCHFVGYFSKEKQSDKGYNLSCIMTLPPFQRKGYGKLLIDFSYLLSRKEGKCGSPEKPLSNLGELSYKKYWFEAIVRQLTKNPEIQMTISDLATQTGITKNDIRTTLQENNMTQNRNNQIVYNNHQYTSSSSSSSTYSTSSSSSASTPPSLLPTTTTSNNNQLRLYVKEAQLVWTPYILSKKNDAGILNIPNEHNIHNNNSSSSSITTTTRLRNTKQTQPYTRTTHSNKADDKRPLKRKIEDDNNDYDDDYIPPSRKTKKR